MADNLSEAQRRKCMRRVKSKNTKPEMRLRKALWARGHRYRLKAAVVGKPDILFPGRRVAIFVDGCFWHGCPAHKNIPTTNHDFWLAKIAKNQERDAVVTDTLMAAGWTVLRFWEHDLKADFEAVVTQIEQALLAEALKRETAVSKGQVD